jgi:hypothetical protein
VILALMFPQLLRGRIRALSKVRGQTRVIVLKELQISPREG